MIKVTSVKNEMEGMQDSHQGEFEKWKSETFSLEEAQTIHQR